MLVNFIWFSAGVLFGGIIAMIIAVFYLED